MAARVVPTLRLAVLCEEVIYDRDGNPFGLNVPVHTVTLPDGAAGPYLPPTLALYLQLSDGVGAFYVTTEVRSEGGSVVYRSKPPVEVVFPGTTHRAVPQEVVLDLHGLAFPGPGAYELLVFCNHTSLHDPNAEIPVPYPPVRVSVTRWEHVP